MLSLLAVSSGIYHITFGVNVVLSGSTCQFYYTKDLARLAVLKRLNFCCEAFLPFTKSLYTPVVRDCVAFPSTHLIYTFDFVRTFNAMLLLYYTPLSLQIMLRHNAMLQRLPPPSLSPRSRRPRLLPPKRSLQSGKTYRQR